MVKKKDAFIKKHLTPDDLGDRSVNVTIGNVAPVSVYDYKQKSKVMKYAMFFTFTKKYMILNETNWDILTEIFGSDDSDDWIGNKVVIFVEDILVGGEPKKALRFTDSPDPQTEEAPPVAEDPPEQKETAEELRDRLASEITTKKEADKASVNNNDW